jgi:hypothetical protein
MKCMDTESNIYNDIIVLTIPHIFAFQVHSTLALWLVKILQKSPKIYILGLPRSDGLMETHHI